ncbi:FMN-dependent dehydrogenase family protein, partial [Chlamydia psittaci 03DC29]
CSYHSFRKNRKSYS